MEKELNNKVNLMTKGTTTVVKKVKLEGVKTLKAERHTSISGARRRKSFKRQSKEIAQPQPIIEELSFDLVEVSTIELKIYRQLEIPSFVLKVEGKLYYTRIPDDIILVSSDILGKHICSEYRKECVRLSAASDENGGCAKVRNHAKCIENYPWITTGYETFCTKMDTFAVIECTHYVAPSQKRKRDVKKLKNKI